MATSVAKVNAAALLLKEMRRICCLVKCDGSVAKENAVVLWLRKYGESVANVHAEALLLSEMRRLLLSEMRRLLLSEMRRLLPRELRRLCCCLKCGGSVGK